ncbi:hypothetical protein P170DRAFT_509518 [Aspergillus steynii IBT 23096]|uniref:Chaperone DnaJ C-terminal domain-containing protein n=1 Tax=Aspergillus steynii IBT 23096 TaxID=1392250 RepID=A0A2I2G7M6_9EURO|nr:uncharacterized protein P170DRAFT_509518 [Aspergillus steynii IBT 23096]PLB48853.1 hypothetical protein P170DRAFT_509518 [Aspergillus steynii IBT 23096]
MALEKSKPPARNNLNAEEVYSGAGFHPFLIEMQDKTIQHLWNARRALMGDTPDTLGDPDLEDADIDARVEKAQHRQREQRKTQMHKATLLIKNLDQLEDISQKLRQQNSSLKVVASVWKRQLLNAGLQPKSIVHRPLEPVDPSANATDNPVSASHDTPSSTAPEPEVVGQGYTLSTNSIPVDIQDSSAAEDDDADTVLSTTNLESSTRGLFPSTQTQIICFPVPVANWTGSSPAFEYAFSDNILITPNALYNPGIRNHPAAPRSKTVNARSGNRKIAISISADHPATVQRLDHDKIIYPETQRYSIGYTQSNGNGQLELPLPLTLEEMFTGVTKEATFFRIQGREKNGALKRRRVTMKLTIDPGVRGGRTMRYENGGNITTTGPQDVCFTVYEIEHPIYQRDHSTLKMFYRGRHIRECNLITFTSVDGVDDAC